MRSVRLMGQMVWEGCYSLLYGKQIAINLSALCQLSDSRWVSAESTKRGDKFGLQTLHAVHE